MDTIIHETRQTQNKVTRTDKGRERREVNTEGKQMSRDRKKDRDGRVRSDISKGKGENVKVDFYAPVFCLK